MINPFQDENCETLTPYDAEAEEKARHDRRVQMEDWCMTAYCTWGLEPIQFIAEIADAMHTLIQIDPYCEK